ncbi:uncharacterized protein LOC134245970 isoform X2 [Saccostrea cucullata]|uniref:uncharacterized protein LOC134245970 isoform X2 n=1 Tax=Saccostrea cuccullata TaxID=36930 RepID=UPI002ED24881
MQIYHIMVLMYTIIIQVDRSPWRKKFTTSTQLEGIDTLLVGGLIPSLTDVMEPKYGNPNLTVNFTGCLSDVNYKPVRGGSFEVQPMKQLRDLKNGSMSVYGPEVPQCSPVDYDDHLVSTTSTVYVPTTTANPLSGVTMPPWDVGGPKIYIIGIGNNGTTPPPPTTTTSTTTTVAIVTTAVDLLTTEEGPTNITLLMGQITTDKVSSMTILIVSTLLALLCLIAILIAVVMRRMRTRYVTYDVRKKYNFDDFELKEPLNHNMETYSPAPPPPKKDIHIATWDEFSMVSATLGSSKKKQNGILPGKVNTLPADVRNLEYPVQTTFLPDDNTKYPVYSCKKNRPASSISEVLEEMERQQRAKELGADPDQYEEPKSHGEGDLEWDPLVDHTPLTMTQDEDSDGKSRATSCESEDPLKILEQQQDLLHEYNADSGYEAESQRNGDEDLDLNESITPPTPDSSKLYYDITGVEGSPQCTSTPHKIIVESEEQFV